MAKRSTTFWWALCLSLLGVVGQLDPCDVPSPGLWTRLRAAVLSRWPARSRRWAASSTPAGVPVTVPRQAPPPPGQGSWTDLFRWSELPVNVVGEAGYMPQIRHLLQAELQLCAASKHRRDREFASSEPFPGHLIREPWHPRDRNAVTLVVAGYQVGYLSAADARWVAEGMDRRGVSMIDGIQVRFVWKVRSDHGRRLRPQEIKVAARLVL